MLKGNKSNLIMDPTNKIIQISITTIHYFCFLGNNINYIQALLMWVKDGRLI